MKEKFLRIKEYLNTEEQIHTRYNRLGDNYFKSKIIDPVVHSVPSVDLAILTCGYEECAPDKIRHIVQKSHYCMHFIVSGQGTVKYKDKEKPVFKGEIFHSPANHFVSYKPDEKNPWSYYYIDFYGLSQEAFFKQMGFSKNDIYYKVSNFEKIKELFETIYSAAIEKGVNSLKSIGNFYLLIDAIIQDRHPENISLTMQEQYIVKSIAYINNNITTANVKSISDNVALSSVYLSKIFKEIIGINLKEFIIVTKMRIAKNWLENSNVNLNFISKRIGLASSKYLIKIFKEIFGQTPIEYRKINSKDTKSEYT